MKLVIFLVEKVRFKSSIPQDQIDRIKPKIDRSELAKTKENELVLVRLLVHQIENRTELSEN